MSLEGVPIYDGTEAKTQFSANDEITGFDGSEVFVRIPISQRIADFLNSLLTGDGYAVTREIMGFRTLEVSGSSVEDSNQITITLTEEQTGAGWDMRSHIKSARLKALNTTLSPAPELGPIVAEAVDSVTYQISLNESVDDGCELTLFLERLES